MDKALAPHTVKPGTDVHVLFYQDAQPHVLTATIASLAPMSLTSSDPKVHLLEPAMRSILVTEENGSVAKAECRVQACEAHGEAWQVNVDVTAWEEVDRRRYPRYAIELPVRLRIVREEGGGASIAEVLAVTKDLSLGGALIKTSADLLPGGLVEMQAALRPKEHVRVLAVVVRALEKECYGLEFLDFVGGSRYAMHGFLSDAA